MFNDDLKACIEVLSPPKALEWKWKLWSTRGWPITMTVWCQVLKALALLRLGRQDESTVLLGEVHGQHPTDDATLQAMSICYREVHRCKCPAACCHVTSASGST